MFINVIAKYLDDEQHLLFSCKANESERREFYIKLSSLHPNFKTSTENSNFIFLMSTDNKAIVRCLAKFVSDSLDIRERASQLCLLNQFINVFSYI